MSVHIVQIVQTLRESPNEDKETGEIRVIVNAFYDFDIGEIFDYNSQKEWELTLGYPRGDGSSGIMIN